MKGRRVEDERSCEHERSECEVKVIGNELGTKGTARPSAARAAGSVPLLCYKEGVHPIYRGGGGGKIGRAHV